MKKNLQIQVLSRLHSRRLFFALMLEGRLQFQISLLIFPHEEILVFYAVFHRNFHF